MSHRENTRDTEEAPECPTCGRTDFASEKGMQQHHVYAHGESIVHHYYECANCGAEVKRDAKSYSENNFCDRKCHGEYLSEHRTGENNPLYNSEMVDCAYCETTVELKKFRIKNAKNNFCSRDCKSKWESENWIEEKSPRWKGGYHDYGPGWNVKKKRKVRERDGYRCQSCGMGRKSHLNKYSEDLNVHHIIPARKFDDKKRANSMDNLTTLCILCHAKWEKIPGLKPIYSEN